MKERVVNTYAAILIITVVGALASLYIIRVAYTDEPTDYSNLDAVLESYS